MWVNARSAATVTATAGAGALNWTTSSQTNPTSWAVYGSQSSYGRASATVELAVLTAATRTYNLNTSLWAFIWVVPVGWSGVISNCLMPVPNVLLDENGVALTDENGVLITA